MSNAEKIEKLSMFIGGSTKTELCIKTNWSIGKKHGWDRLTKEQCA